MINFLFWNINRKPLQSSIARLAAQHNVNLIILAESEIVPETMLDSLYQQTGLEYCLTFSFCEKITIYLSFPAQLLTPFRETERLTIRRLALLGLPDILIAATHFPSKLNWREDSQTLEYGRLAETIRDAEREIGHSRTLLVGDLNMNPFESGIVGAAALHGVMTRQIAKNRHRIVQGTKYPFFYNPMWGRFGDLTQGAAGTYYKRRAEHISYDWNMFDQVLLRPDLLPYFQNENLNILTHDGEMSLVSDNGLPDDTLASDHLPILFSLNL
jgi:hypothetical protein